MTEKEKAAQGLLYDWAGSTELQADIRKARDVLYRFNRLPPSEETEREQLLAGFLGRFGADSVILSPFHCDYGYNTEIGDHFFANVNLVILDAAKVRIGSHVFIAPNVGIYTAGHPLDVNQRNACLEYAYPVTIGDNVWIGAQSCILPGVTIGDNTVIGAGSVVNKSIPANVLAAGNPCRVIRELGEVEASEVR